jgi:hypothetical protein
VRGHERSEESATAHERSEESEEEKNGKVGVRVHEGIGAGFCLP